jgi:hypothetical protein
VDVVAGVLRVDGVAVPTRYPVADACLSGGNVIVIYAPEANPRSWGTFRNLASVSADGSELWLADTSETTTGDHFYRIAQAEPLWVYAFRGYDCRIDPETGRILEKVFTK